MSLFHINKTTSRVSLLPLTAVLVTSFFAFIYYQIVRIEFYLWNLNNYAHVSAGDLSSAFLSGLRFDALAIIWFSAIPLLLSFVPWPRVSFKRQAQVLIFAVLIFQFPAILLGMIDSEYIHFVGRRWTLDSLFMFGEAKGKVSAFFVTHWLLIGINFILLSIFWILGCAFLKNKFLSRLDRLSATWSMGFVSYVTLCFSTLIWAIVLARGGFQEKPLSFAHGHLFPSTELNQLVMNTGFSLLKSGPAAGLKPTHFFDSESENWLGYLNGFQGEPSQFDRGQITQKPNVIILVMESFGSEYVGLKNPSYTPFLDSLISESVYFPNAFANGRRSIEGIASILTGIPALMTEPLIASVFQNNQFEGLGTTLKKSGYTTAFFHGANRGSMFFDQFMPRVGIDQYYGAQDYPDQKDHDGTWGIYDEPFLGWMSEQISGHLQQPFFITFFSLTSHHPYRVPEKYKNAFPKGPIEILPTIAYADLSLKEFFEKSKTQAWFKNTIFIITGDHTSKNYRPEFQNEISAYRVPILIYSPTFKFPVVPATTIAQHIDILPTVLDLTGASPSAPVQFGRSLFSPGPRSAVFFTGTSYLFDGETATGSWNLEGPMSFFEKDENYFQKIKRPESADLLLQEKQFKATLEYFTRGLLENKLTTPERLMR